MQNGVLVVVEVCSYIVPHLTFTVVFVTCDVSYNIIKRICRSYRFPLSLSPNFASVSVPVPL